MAPAQSLKPSVVMLLLYYKQTVTRCSVAWCLYCYSTGSDSHIHTHTGVFCEVRTEYIKQPHSIQVSFLRCNKCGAYSERPTPSFYRGGDAISKHLNGLGTKKNLILDTDEVRHHKWLCWRGTVAVYYYVMLVPFPTREPIWMYPCDWEIPASVIPVKSGNSPEVPPSEMFNNK
jgi:hypothetical protein